MFHVKQLEYKVRATCELFQFLIEQMPDTSRTKVKELLAHSVCVDGRKVSQFNYPLQPGMRVTIATRSGLNRAIWILCLRMNTFL